MDTGALTHTKRALGRGILLEVAVKAREANLRHCKSKQTALGHIKHHRKRS